MSPLSREAIFAVLSGLTALACDKAATPTAEPLLPAASAQPGAAPGAAAASAAPAAKEVPAASAQPAEKEKSCAPGGCAPGKCGANK
jgi:hypothetical protein